MKTNRRKMVLGGLAVASGFAGCLDDTRSDDEPDPNPDADDGTAAPNESTDDSTDATDSDDGNVVPDAARTVGEETVEAIANAEFEEAAGNAPPAYFEAVDRELWTVTYEEFWQPNAIRSITFADGEGDESVTTSFAEQEGIDEATGYRLEYDVAFETQGERYERPVAVAAVRVDGDWYAWIDEDGWLSLRTQAAVDVSKEDMTTVTITFTSRNGPATVFVRGGGIDEPTDYRLDEVGDALTVTADDVGSGSFEVVASTDGPDSATATTVATFSVVDPSAWAATEEVVLEGQTPRWVGVEPTHIEGVENPVLVLREGREYTITATNGDGSIHKFELRDEDDAVVDDYETDFLEGEGAEQQLTVTASDELASYACVPHESLMHADVTVVDSFDESDS